MLTNRVEVTNVDPPECILLGSLLVKRFYPITVHSCELILGIANGCRGYNRGIRNRVSTNRRVRNHGYLYPLRSTGSSLQYQIKSRCFHLTHFSGCMMGRVFGLYLLITLLEITISLYGFLSGLKGKQVDFVREIHMAIPCLSFISILYYFCNYAHRFSHGVSLY
jgi:hypothetical protein